MSKKQFIALANAIREHNRTAGVYRAACDPFTDGQIECLANFCQSENPRFMRERWNAYIKGECGPNGGAVKKAKI